MSEAFEPSGRKMVGNADVQKECEALESEIASLKASYDQYFLGLERRPPTDKHNELKKRVGQLKGFFVRSTALRFRSQSLAQKFATYERLWQRTLQEIENGTYHRHLARARRRQTGTDAAAAKAASSERKPGRDDFSIDEVSPEEAEALLSGAAFAKKPVAPTVAPVAPMAPMAPVVPPVAPARPASRPAAPQGQQGSAAALSDEKLRAVYDALVKAKKRCNEDVSKLSYDQVAQSLRKQVPDLMQKHNARGVEFKVVIKDGKALLRAVPKEG